MAHHRPTVVDARASCVRGDVRTGARPCGLPIARPRFDRRGDGRRGRGGRRWRRRGRRPWHLGRGAGSGRVTSARPALRAVGGVRQRLLRSGRLLRDGLYGAVLELQPVDDRRRLPRAAAGNGLRYRCLRRRRRRRSEGLRRQWNLPGRAGSHLRAVHLRFAGGGLQAELPERRRLRRDVLRNRGTLPHPPGRRLQPERRVRVESLRERDVLQHRLRGSLFRLQPAEPRGDLLAAAGRLSRRERGDRLNHAATLEIPTRAR